MKVNPLSIEDLHQSLIQREYTTEDVVNTYFDAIDTMDTTLNAYTEVFRDSAIATAKGIDDKMSKGETIPLLAGVPISIKDAILTEGSRTTASSHMLQNYTAVYDATVIQKIQDQGMIILGKTNLDEFAMGSSTENSAFFTTKNPHDVTKVPGGSSGGSAVSVASNMALVSLGSDTGGSIRQPAAFTGTVGLKPTYGRVSRFGLIAMASSLDQIGPFSRSVLDSAHVLKAIEGFDPMDATSVKLDHTQQISIDSIKKRDLSTVTIGLPKEYFVEGIDPEIQVALNEVIAFYKDCGVRFKDISLPYTEYAIPTYYILMPAEVSSNLARFDGIRYGLSEFEKSHDLQDVYRNSRSQGFGNEPMRRIMLGTYVLSSGYADKYYSRARKVQQYIRQDFTRAFESVDIILTPTTPNLPFGIGEKASDPLSLYLEDIFTVAVNIAGIPAISVPALTSSKSGLPIGFQLMANHFNEQTLLTVAHALDSQRIAV